MEIKYINQKEFKVDTAYFEGFLKKLEGSVKTEQGILNVVFVNDQYIQALNKTYRGKDRPTNVLSFTYGADGLLGEVYVSVETAKRQAKKFRHPLADELIQLIVHGILHVHGYDHEEEEDYKKMFALEKKILGELAGK